MSSADEIVWNVLNDWAFAILKAFPYPTTYDELRENMAKLSAMERSIAGLRWTESEVFNGGFEQLYVNSGGFWSLEAVSGFKLIGRDDFANIVSRSLHVFPSPATACIQDDAEKYLDENGSMLEQLSGLDDEFYEVEEANSMRVDILNFARRHVVDGKVA